MSASVTRRVRRGLNRDRVSLARFAVEQQRTVPRVRVGHRYTPTSVDDDLPARLNRRKSPGGPQAAATGSPKQG